MLSPEQVSEFIQGIVKDERPGGILLAGSYADGLQAEADELNIHVVVGNFVDLLRHGWPLDQLHFEENHRYGTRIGIYYGSESVIEDGFLKDPKYARLWVEGKVEHDPQGVVERLKQVASGTLAR